MIVILILAFFIATYTDIKNHTIPIFIFPTVTLIHIICCYINGEAVITSNEHWIIIKVVFILYLLMALFFQGGGGDIIMMTSLSILLKEDILVIIIISHILLGGYGLIRYFLKKENGEIPFTPFVFASYLLFFIGGN